MSAKIIADHAAKLKRISGNKAGRIQRRKSRQERGKRGGDQTELEGGSHIAVLVLDVH